MSRVVKKKNIYFDNLGRVYFKTYSTLVYGVNHLNLSL